MLAGCNSDDISLANNAKANQPVPPKLIQAMTDKDMDLNSPILVRIFKQEAELEIWKQNRSGQFRAPEDLSDLPLVGRSRAQGQGRRPPGAGRLLFDHAGADEPAIAFYLSFNTGYPNAFDKALGRTGSQLMVHGDCSSRGCYAMTDEQIAEIYSLGRESFFGGQRSFQLQAYPFKMTPVNMAKHRNNPNMPFWRMIKEGYDHFEVTKQEPKVEFCEKKYVFDAIRAPNATRDPVFDASAKCPAYAISDEVADAVREKQQAEAAETAKLISQGTPVARAQHRHRRRHEQGVRRHAFLKPAPACPKAATARACRCCRWPARPAPSPPTSIRRVHRPTTPARRTARAELVAVPASAPARGTAPLRRGSPTPRRPRNPTDGSPASPARSASAAADATASTSSTPPPRRSPR